MGTLPCHSTALPASDRIARRSFGAGVQRTCQGRSRGRPCQAFWEKNRQSSSSQQGGGNNEGPLPLIIPDVLPPPARGNQYKRPERNDSTSSTSSTGSGGRGGGVFSMFSNGGSGWSGGPGSLIYRLRLLVLSTLWASCIYLILSSAFRCLAWLNRKLGITAALGYGGSGVATSGRGRGKRAAGAGAGDQDEEEDSEEVMEVVGVLHTKAAGLAAGAAARDASGPAGAAAAAAAAAEEAAARTAGVAGATSAAADGVRVGEASPLDSEQRAHLDALKRYGEWQEAAGGGAPGAGGQQPAAQQQQQAAQQQQQQARRAGVAGVAGAMDEGQGFAGHATSAYFMVFATMAFFFVVQ